MPDRKSLSPLERFLCLFTDVRAGEGGTALAMFANVFLILCAYYLMKPLREGWIAVSPVAGHRVHELVVQPLLESSVTCCCPAAAYRRSTLPVCASLPRPVRDWCHRVS